MIQLTYELAKAMLDVWDRRKPYPKGTKFASTVLEAALQGKPDFLEPPPSRVKQLARWYGSPWPKK